MFQRIRGAIDARIAEEQARQKASQDSLSRSNSGARRANPSPARRPSSRLNRGNSFLSKNPDPAEFDAEFVVGDDESSTRTSTPLPEVETNTDARELDEKASAADPSQAASTPPPGKAPAQTPAELPTDVRVKLRRLDKLESRYQELLKAYKVAHSRVLSIEPFEAALRENTPLTSIGEPRALTEYLNQLNLKGDMVVDELKRVTAERDDFKKQVEAAEKSTREAWDEITNLKKSRPADVPEVPQNVENLDGKESRSSQVATPSGRDSLETSQHSPTPSITSRATSIRGLFSPKAKAVKSTPPPEENEEFFSFENEIPKLESELKEKEHEVASLKSEIQILKGDLSVARESTEGMVHSLEAATREVSELRDKNDRTDSQLKEERNALQQQIANLESKLKSTETELSKASAAMDDLKRQLEESEAELQKVKDASSSSGQKETNQTSPDQKRIDVLQGVVTNLKSQLKDAEATVQSLKADISSAEAESKSSQKVVEFLDRGLGENAEWKKAKTCLLGGQEADFEKFRQSLLQSETSNGTVSVSPQNPPPQASNGKKKKKKKRKGGNKTESEVDNKDILNSQEPDQPSNKDKETILALETQVTELIVEVGEKNAAIDRLHAQLKGEAILREEIESLRDDLTDIGQNHVEAKDKVKDLLAQKAALEKTIESLEKEIIALKESSTQAEPGSEKAHDDLMADFEELKAKAVTLETDLSAAQQLAASRFKELADLRQSLQKLQPELRTLRQESTDLKATKEDLKNKASELSRLERIQEDLRAEIKGLKTRVSEKDTEIKTLNQKISQESNNRLKAEQGLETARSDLRYSESQKQQAIEKGEQTSRDLSNTQEQLQSANAKLRNLEEEVSKLKQEVGNLHDEIQLKTAQHASAQSLMNNMRDQSSEMAMQVKEARERCEGLEEELSDAQRLLSERTREGETMRRLLSEVELKADQKVRDFKERLEAAIEERDRAEDEANLSARKRSREMEELKTKARDAERALRRTEEDKEELEHSQKEWKRKRDELETELERSRLELVDVRDAMSQLRDALDENEKEARDFDKERSELRRSAEEANQRLEKLKKANKSLSDDLKAIQAAKGRVEAGSRTPRSSIDSGAARGVMSPSSRTRNGSRARGETPMPGSGSIDHVYLKNVLLQFLEQKDRGHQKQLIPVLGMLLHFDENDEQKWMSAISSK